MLGINVLTLIIALTVIIVPFVANYQVPSGRDTSLYETSAQWTNAAR
jgi:hypothetical protein